MGVKKIGRDGMSLDIKQINHASKKFDRKIAIKK
jgi:hypothetical protein